MHTYKIEQWKKVDNPARGADLVHQRPQVYSARLAVDSSAFSETEMAKQDGTNIL